MNKDNKIAVIIIFFYLLTFAAEIYFATKEKEPKTTIVYLPRRSQYVGKIFI